MKTSPLALIDGIFPIDYLDCKFIASSSDGDASMFDHTTFYLESAFCTRIKSKLQSHEGPSLINGAAGKHSQPTVSRPFGWPTTPGSLILRSVTLGSGRPPSLLCEAQPAAVQRLRQLVGAWDMESALC